MNKRKRSGSRADGVPKCRWCVREIVAGDGERVMWVSLDHEAPGELHYHLACFTGPMTYRFAELMRDMTALWMGVAINADQIDNIFDATQHMDELCEFLWPLPPDARTLLVAQAHQLRMGPAPAVTWGAPRHTGDPRHNVQ